MARSRLRRLSPYLVRYRSHFGTGAALLVVTNVLALMIPGRIGAAVQLLRDAYVADAEADARRIGALALVIVGLALASGLTRVGSRISVFNGGRLVEYDVRNEVFAHLTRLDQQALRGSATGDLVSRCINDVTQIRLLFGVGILNLVNTAVAYAVVLTLMFRLSPELALLSLAPYPFVFAAMGWFTRALYARSMTAQQQLSVLSSRAQEAWSGIAVVKAFAIEDRIAAGFDAESQEYVRRNMAVALVRGGLMPFMRVAAGLGTLIVLAAGGRAVISGELPLGKFVEFSGYVVGLAWPTMALGWVLAVYNRGSAAFDRTCEILDTRPSVDPASAPRASLPNPGATPSLSFRGVGLDYDDGTVALDGVDLEIPAGATVAIVGPTGGGKSSLVQLIPRLRDPTRGQVLLDGVPLHTLSVESVRALIGFVPQDGFLFSRPLRDNILLGAAPGADVEAAVASAGLDGDLAALPAGLDTLVGERGVTLSGGQRQRATLARAIARDPAVLVLDDALSAVDTRTERRILEGLRSLLGGRTTIIVTHRYNALDLVDEIFVLDGGRLVERGTHKQLLAAGGRYAELVEEQRLEEEADRYALSPAEAER